MIKSQPWHSWRQQLRQTIIRRRFPNEIHLCWRHPFLEVATVALHAITLIVDAPRVTMAAATASCTISNITNYPPTPMATSKTKMRSHRLPTSDSQAWFRKSLPVRQPRHEVDLVPMSLWGTPSTAISMLTTTQIHLRDEALVPPPRLTLLAALLAYVLKPCFQTRIFFKTIHCSTLYPRTNGPINLSWFLLGPSQITLDV